MPDQAQIDHIVVLMLENRSFDHMLGWSLGVLTGQETNWLDPTNPALGEVKVSSTAAYEGLIDPGHEFDEVHQQLESPSPPPPATTNGGFVASYLNKLRAEGKDTNRVNDVMAGFAPGALPVLETLAHEFAVCTNWFSSVPGPTWPNRFFVQSAQSGGQLGNRPVFLPSIFESLSAAGKSSHIYFHDIPQALANFTLLGFHLRGDPHFGVSRYRQFKEDVDAGHLPTYSFIEPQYFEVGDIKQGWMQWLYRLIFKGTKASDQHPPHDVKMGEWLIKDVYDTLRTSKHEYWKKTMFLVTWDEHGGLYDNKYPPAAVSPTPGHLSAEGFAFDRLGVRVPTVIISPCVTPGTVDTTIYDHTSICATLEALFDLQPLTERDRAALPVTGIRSDHAPRKWPAIGGQGLFWSTHVRTESTEPPSDLQRDLHNLALDLVAETEVGSTEDVQQPQAGAAMRAEAEAPAQPAAADLPVTPPIPEEKMREQVNDVMKRLFDAH